MRNWKQWIKLAGIRAIKSMAEGALAVIGGATFVGDVNWLAVASGAVIAGITSLLMSLKGLPEEQQIEVNYIFSGEKKEGEDDEYCGIPFVTPDEGGKNS